MKNQLRITKLQAYFRCLIILLLTLICSAQTHAKLGGQPLIDSLLKELPKQKEDTNKVNLFNELSVSSWNVNPDDGIKYGQAGLELATKSGWEKGIAQCNANLGINYWSKSDFAKALTYYTMALKAFEEIDNKQGISSVLGGIGIVYDCQSDYDRALEYYFKALKMDEETGNKKGASKIVGNIGIVYQNQSDYARALEYYFKALKIDGEVGNKLGSAIVTGNIGNVYLYQNDYTNALEYYFKALKMHEEMEDKNGVARVTGNIAIVYEDRGDATMALEYHFKALKMDEEIGDKNGVADNTHNIGVFYEGQHKYTDANVYFFKALKIDEEIGDKNDEAKCLGSIAGNYVQMARDPAGLHQQANTAGSISAPPEQENHVPHGKEALLHKAVEYINKAITIDRELNNLQHLEENYQRLSAADSLLGDYKGALNAISQFIIFKDSVFSKDNAKKIVQQQMRYDYGKREDSLNLENLRNEKAAALKLQRQRGYTYAGIAGIIILALFSFFIVKERGKSEQERIKSDNLLLNILPDEIANELKRSGSSAARHYENVTVIFTDFVNFTKAGEKMSPQQLVDELHTCFKAFDEITAKYNIEKIKTIGDAYLAVCGLPIADSKHAEKAVGAACEINNFMESRYAHLGDRTFQTRIGINSGTVVAGIVGVKKFAYDIWGDTVNTAARMEQNSEPGKINISEATYELVKDKFSCEYRGEIDAKGKGEIKMYFVSE